MNYQPEQPWALSDQQCQGPVGQHAPPAPPQVLALGTCERGRVELRRHADGSLAINVGGAEVPAFHWPAADEQQCVDAFLKLISR